MRLLEAAWVLFGLSASALTAGWWQPAFIWAAVAFALFGLVACCAATLFTWTAVERKAMDTARLETIIEADRKLLVAKVSDLEQRVEALQKAQAFQALR